MQEVEKIENEIEEKIEEKAEENTEVLEAGKMEEPDDRGPEDLFPIQGKAGKKRKKALNMEKLRGRDKRLARRKKILIGIKLGIATIIAAFFAILFMMPIVLSSRAKGMPAPMGA